MTNNKQQTAVEWQFEQLFNSFEKFNNGEYSFDEYLKRNLEIRAQAKEMEKEQIMQSHMFGDCRGQIGTYLRAVEYYNETYGGGEQ
jgi:hypothetical protein